jgi:hypothetical protein
MSGQPLTAELRTLIVTVAPPSRRNAGRHLEVTVQFPRRHVGADGATASSRGARVRMALGAGRETVLGSVMVHGLTLALIGLVGGLAAALMLTRLRKALLLRGQSERSGDPRGRRSSRSWRRPPAWYPPFAPRAAIRSWRSGTSSDYQTYLTHRRSAAARLRAVM